VRKEQRKAVALITALPGVGHFSAAVIYVTMGLLAGLVALGFRGEAPDARAAFRALRDQPFGPFLLLVVAAGSLCLVGWRLLQAFADIESKGKSFVGLFKRARFLSSAVFYLGVPVLITRMLLGRPIRPGEQIAEDAASVVIDFPFGWSLILGTGMGFLVAGGYCLYRMIRGNFEGIFHCEKMTKRQRKLCFAAGRLGYAARGAIFLVIGYYLMLAGWNVNPAQVEGQAGALHVMARQPLGPLMLGIVSLGFIAFGVFSLAEFRYGKIPVERVQRVVEKAQAAR
jgi:hypothetical protein